MRFAGITAPNVNQQAKFIWARRSFHAKLEAEAQGYIGSDNRRQDDGIAGKVRVGRHETMIQVTPRSWTLAATLTASILVGEASAMIPVEKLAPAVVLLKQENKDKSPAGTGFLIQSENALFLVTAHHVSRILTPSSQCTIQTPDGRPFSFELNALVPKAKTLPWQTHDKADVAVLRLDPPREFFETHLSGHFMPRSWLEPAEQGPLRSLTITILGFPLQLGVSQ